MMSDDDDDERFRMKPTNRQRSRSTAEERRKDVLSAAIVEFATYGLHGASTVTIAERAGISQPYVLRLFDTKKNLFLESVVAARQLILVQWERALVSLPGDVEPKGRLEALAQAFQQITGEGDVMRLFLQAFAASADADVKDACQSAMSELFQWVRFHTGVSGRETQVFFAQGMTIMVGVSIGAPGLMHEEWAQAFMMQEMDGGTTITS